MTIKQKAKAYDEALEKARQLCAYPTTKPFISDLQDLFPELMESEDERIRKALIKYYSFDKDGGSHALDNITPEQILDWLERQGKQGSIKEHDICDTCDEKTSCVIPCPMKLVGQKPTDCSEDDEYYYDIIQYILNNECVGKTDKENAINWFKSLKDRYTWKPSDEQITWLYRAADNASKDSRMKQVLNELLSDLKKLRGE